MLLLRELDAAPVYAGVKHIAHKFLSVGRCIFLQSKKGGAKLKDAITDLGIDVLAITIKPRFCVFAGFDLACGCAARLSGDFGLECHRLVFRIVRVKDINSGYE